MALVECIAVGKTYPGEVQACQQVSFTLGERDLLVLAGPNGCGKSTVLQLLAGAEAPSQGEVLLAGRPVHEIPAEERSVAMVYSGNALYPHMTVEKNLSYSLKIRNMEADEIEKRVQEAARAAGVDRLLKKRPTQLDALQRFRVGLARAMVHRAQVYLLDDLLAGAEPRYREAMLEEIRGWQRRSEASFVYATASAADALALGGRIAMMDQGKLLQTGAAEALHRAPARLSMVGFWGGEQTNVLDAQLAWQDQSLHILAQGLCLPIAEAQQTLLAPLVDRALKLALYADDIRLDEGFLAQQPQLCVEAVVQVCELIDSEVYLFLLAEGARLCARTTPDATAKSGDFMRVGVNLDRAMLFDAQSGENVLDGQQK